MTDQNKILEKILNRIFGRSSPMNQVRRVLERRQGGIYKRLDENRELFEHLQKFAPEYLDTHPWVAGWIKAQDEFLLELIAAAEIKPPHIHPIYVMAGEEWPRPWRNKGVFDDFSGLVFSTPTSYKAIFNSDNKAKIDLLISRIEIEVIEVTEIIWWAYRVPPHNCIACDIYGSDPSNALNITITIAGETVIPSCPQEESFEFRDETDAWCFLTLLIERFQLTHVNTISEGLGLQFSGRAIDK